MVISLISSLDLIDLIIGLNVTNLQSNIAAVPSIEGFENVKR